MNVEPGDVAQVRRGAPQARMPDSRRGEDSLTDTSKSDDQDALDPQSHQIIQRMTCTGRRDGETCPGSQGDQAHAAKSHPGQMYQENAGKAADCGYGEEEGQLPNHV